MGMSRHVSMTTFSLTVKKKKSTLFQIQVQLENVIHPLVLVEVLLGIEVSVSVQMRWNVLWDVEVFPLRELLQKIS